MTAPHRRGLSRGLRGLFGVFAVLLAAGLLAACTGGGSTNQRPLPNGPYSTRPNIVFILTDDLSDNLVQYMPHVIALERAGMRFTNYTVADSLCCPSRATILTGRFPHNTKIFTNGAPDGGFDLFHARGEDRQTFAVPLHEAGYRTAFLGKYLNGLQIPSDNRPGNTRDEHYIPPGWSTWDAAGYGYDEFGYDLNQNGTLHHYGQAGSDYLTNVIGHLGSRYITQSARARKPFFLELATFAPHTPSTPAPRDKGTFHLQVPEGSSFDRHPTDSPQWLAQLPTFTPDIIERLGRKFTKRVEAVQAVDRTIGKLEETLKRTRQWKNTVFVFTSDNGYHIGEHGLESGKLTAFDTDVRVPLVVTGPGIAQGSDDADIVENTDLAPTFEELAGATTPATVDGRSFVPLLHGQHPSWRALATVEHHGPVFGPYDPDEQNAAQGNPPTYDAMRSASYTYVRYADGQREYYDRTTDPDENHNIIGTLTPRRIAGLDTILDRLIVCKGTVQCWAAARPTDTG